MNRTTGFLVIVGFLVLSLSNSVMPSLAQDAGQPPLAAKGPFGVGIYSLTLVDAARGDWQMYTLVWYPAEAGRSSYLVPDYQAKPDMTGAPYPLIFFSHGLWGTNSDMLGLGPHLASYGFVVVSIQHQDPAYPDTGMEIVDRPLDVLAVLGQLSTMTEGNLADVIDTNNVGVAGYSSGGDTALLLDGVQIDPENYLEWCVGQRRSLGTCQIADVWDEVSAYRTQFTPLGDGQLWPAFTDARIHAAMPMAPCESYMYGESGLAVVTLPTMILGSTEDEFCPYERDAAWIYQHLGSRARYLVTQVGTSHMTPFQDSAVKADIQHFATAFFGYYLQGKTDYAVYLTPESAASLSNVTLETASQ